MLYKILPDLQLDLVVDVRHLHDVSRRVAKGPELRM